MPCSFQNRLARRAVAPPAVSGRTESSPARFRTMAAAQISVCVRAGAAKLNLADCELRFQTQSNPSPAGAARSKLSLPAGPILFPAPAIFPAAIPASRPRAEPRRQPRSKTSASPAGSPLATSARAKISRLARWKMFAAAPARSKEFSANRQGWSRAR